MLRRASSPGQATTNHDWLQATSFVDTDGKPQESQLWGKGQAAATTSPAHSITTYVLE